MILRSIIISYLDVHIFIEPAQSQTFHFHDHDDPSRISGRSRADPAMSRVRLFAARDLQPSHHRRPLNATHIPKFEPCQ